MKKFFLSIIVVIVIFGFNSCKQYGLLEVQKANLEDSITKLIQTNKDLGGKLKVSTDTANFYKKWYTNLKYENDSLSDIRKSMLKINYDYELVKQNYDTLKIENQRLNDTILKIKKENLDLRKEIAKLEKQSKKKINVDTAGGGTKVLDFKDLDTWAKTLEFSGSNFDAYVTSTKVNNINFYLNDGKNKQYKTIYALKKDLTAQSKKLIFATNGGMFNELVKPNGLYVENSKTIVDINLSKEEGNFYMDFGDEKNSNGIFIIDKNNKAYVCKASEYSKYEKDVLYATQSGPILLFNKQINPQFTEGSKNIKLRSGVGIISETKVVFIISKEPVNFYDFAKLFKDYFGCSNAMFLDGQISEMYLPEIKREDLGGPFGVIIGISKK